MYLWAQYPTDVTNILLNFSWLLCSSLSRSLSLCQCLSPWLRLRFPFLWIASRFSSPFWLFWIWTISSPWSLHSALSWACCEASGFPQVFYLFSSFTELSNFFSNFVSLAIIEDLHPFQKTSLKMLRVRDNLFLSILHNSFFFFFISIPQMCKSSFMRKNSRITELMSLLRGWVLLITYSMILLTLSLDLLIFCKQIWW